MSALVCSISGNTPEEPVFSKTGYVFERRVIEKYLKANGDVCPVTGEELTADDLTPIKANKTVKPRPVTATSIPGMLSLMQSEWDSLLTEMYSMRSHLETVRNQLSHSLYQHDAACRVIARMLKERDSLRQQLTQLQDQLASHPGGAQGSAESTEETGLSSDTLDQLKTLAKSLLAQRKKRNLEGVAAADDVKGLKEAGSYSIHSSTTPGVSCCVVDNATQPGPKRFWSGGVDGVVALFDLDKEKTVSRLVGHLKRVNQVLCVDRVVVSASDDKSVRIWTASEDQTDYRTSYIMRKHSKAVTSISLHPSGDLLTTSSKDGTWGIHDLHTGVTRRMYRDQPCQFRNVSFHPDGMLLGGSGSDGQLHIYDLKGGNLPQVSLPSHSGPVTSIQFSENGYYLASASTDGTVKMWDLRKTANFETVQPTTSTGATFVPDKVNFDHSGQYLAACGTNGSVAVYGFETRTTLQQLCSLDAHSDRATDASFGYNSTFLVTSSMDRTVKLWTAAQ